MFGMEMAFIRFKNTGTFLFQHGTFYTRLNQSNGLIVIVLRYCTMKREEFRLVIWVTTTRLVCVEEQPE